MFSHGEPPHTAPDRDGGSGRSFRMEGKLGGLRYDFGARISKLAPGGSGSHEREVAAGSEPARIAAAQVERDACGDPIDVWESEGGH